MDEADLDPITAVIAERVRKLRTQVDMSQGALAERMAELGAPWKRATVVHLEKRSTASKQRGAIPGRSSISVQDVIRLATVFNTTIYHLMAMEPPPAPGPCVGWADACVLRAISCTHR